MCPTVEYTFTAALSDFHKPFKLILMKLRTVLTLDDSVWSTPLTEHSAPKQQPNNYTVHVRTQYSHDTGRKAQLNTTVYNLTGFPILPCHWGTSTMFPVSVEAKLSFVEPGRKWAHSHAPSKAPGISYQGTMKTSMRMLKTSGGL